MGTVFQFSGDSPFDQAATDRIVDSACDLLHEADRIFSLYKPNSPLSQLARGEISVAQCPPVVSQIWDDCERWERATDGWFSAFTPENTFDPSGLVKTWAAQRAIDRLLDAGIRDFTANAGGDVWIGDAVTDPIDWRIAIHKPVSIAAADAGTLTVIDLRGTQFRAMATSGSAERGLHIWDPKAGGKAAANSMLQVSVVARDLVTADVWATAAFAEGPDCLARLERVAGLEALIVKRDGDLAATSGFIDLLAKPE